MNCFACSQNLTWSAEDENGLDIPVSSAEPLMIDGMTVVEVEDNFLILPDPGAYVLPGINGQRSITCSSLYEARLLSPGESVEKIVCSIST